MTDDTSTPETMYLDLLKNCLTRSIFPESYREFNPARGTLRASFYAPLRKLLASRGLELVQRVSVDPAKRAEGREWPSEAETMVGLRRLENLQCCITDVIRQGVPGDLIETGAWRGGSSIFMRAVLKVYGDTNRTVWVADSFQGLPKPDAARYPADQGDTLWHYPVLAVPVETVRANFARYGLFDDQVKFLVGWFRDTIPTAPIEQLAVLRLDGDLYESTMDALRPLYAKVSMGGYVIVDDYGAMESCRAAVDDFRAEHGITEPIQRIDWTGAFWQKLH
jgi:O-methyltransferase